MDHDRLCETMRALALRAGDAILAVRRGAMAGDDLGAALKDDLSPVTAADLAADRIIGAGLAEAFPDIPLVTEERAESHGAIAGGEFLIVDPLDGTKEFLRGAGDFTVNIAYVRDGVPVRGVVYAPASGRLFYTNAAGVAVEEDGPKDPSRVGVAVPLRVAEPDNGALRVVASKSHRDAATDAYVGLYDVAAFRSAGSSLKFCLVASGEADLYPRLGRTMEWDTAAGQAVLLGAGGRVVRFDDHRPLLYGKPGFENPHFIAHAPGVALKPGRTSG
jgi:3'(2'), 5'-bisphosphate nucleotidase